VLFNEGQKQIRARCKPKRMLIQDLRQMQASNLLVRKDYQQVPPKVEYSVTPFGRALGKLMAPLCA
jgi:DNA-binding HxlR family transcriptional regulator